MGKMIFSEPRWIWASSKSVEISMHLRGHVSAHWAQYTHRPRSREASNRFSPTFVIVMAWAGQSRMHRRQPLHLSDMNFGWPRKSFGITNFSKGYRIVAGLLNRLPRTGLTMAPRRRDFVRIRPTLQTPNVVAQPEPSASPAFLLPSPSLTLSPLLTPQPQKTVSIVFDDGLESQLAAVAVLDQYGYKATFGVIVSKTGAPNYMNWTTIFALHEQGHDIESHGYHHLDLNCVDNQNLNDETILSRSILEAKGYSADVFIYPFGAGGENGTVRNLVSQHYRAARGIRQLPNKLSSLDKYNLNAAVIVANTTADTFASNLEGDNAVNILIYHGIGEPQGSEDYLSVGLEAFQSQMRYLQENNFKVETLRNVLIQTAP